MAFPHIKEILKQIRRPVCYNRNGLIIKANVGGERNVNGFARDQKVSQGNGK